MITGEVEGNWEEKLSEFENHIKMVGATDCIVHPTKVLFELSRMKGRAVLGLISQSVADRVKAEMVPLVEAAVKGKPEGWRQSMTKQYRRWAYRFIEELYVEVRDKRRWGRVEDPDTLASKRSDMNRQKNLAAQARAEAQANRPKKPRRPRQLRPLSYDQAGQLPTRRKPSNRNLGMKSVESWGVRHTRPDWRNVQKGKADSGTRRPSIKESGPKIVVMIEGQVISST